MLTNCAGLIESLQLKHVIWHLLRWPGKNHVVSDVASALGLCQFESSNLKLEAIGIFQIGPKRQELMAYCLDKLCYWGHDFCCPLDYFICYVTNL